MATTLTPQEISEILEQFFDVTGKRQYIGARYVPLFGRKGEDSIEWDNSEPYEPLTIVLYQGNSYTSRTYVPADVDISDTDYWAQTGNYNAQIEVYRNEVANIATEVATITNIIPATEFDSTNTVKEYIDSLRVDSLMLNNVFRPCDYDAIELIGSVPNDSNHTFQGGYYYGGYYYLAHYLDTSSNTVISKYDSEFNLIDSVTLTVAHHINCINVDPISGNLLCGGTNSTSRLEYYVIDPASMDIVRTVPFGYVNSFCISSNGEFAISSPSGSNGFILYGRVGNNYVGMGIIPPINNGFVGRQGISPFKSGFMRLCSRGSSGLSNYLECITANGGYKFTIVFSDKYSVEYEWATYVSDSEIILGDASGNIYRLDARLALSGFAEFNEQLTMNYRPQFCVPRAEPFSTILSATVRSIRLLYTFEVPPIFYNYGAGYVGYLSGSTQRCDVSFNALNNSAIVEGSYHQDVDGTMRTITVQLEYTTRDNTNCRFILKAMRVYVDNEANSLNFSNSTDRATEVALLDDFLTSLYSRYNSYVLPASNVTQGVWLLGNSPSFLGNGITLSTTEESQHCYEFLLSDNTYFES